MDLGLVSGECSLAQAKCEIWDDGELCDVRDFACLML